MGNIRLNTRNPSLAVGITRGPCGVHHFPQDRMESAGLFQGKPIGLCLFWAMFRLGPALETMPPVARARGKWLLLSIHCEVEALGTQQSEGP